MLPNLFGQENAIIPLNLGNRWIYSGEYECRINGYCDYIRSYSVIKEVEGDTIVDSVNWKKISRTETYDSTIINRFELWRADSQYVRIFRDNSIDTMWFDSNLVADSCWSWPITCVFAGTDTLWGQHYNTNRWYIYSNIMGFIGKSHTDVAFGFGPFEEFSYSADTSPSSKNVYDFSSTTLSIFGAYLDGQYFGGPAPPENLVATADTTSITLIWSANLEPDIAYYNIYSLSEGDTFSFLLSTNSPLDTVALIDSLLPNTEYQFKITAIDTEQYESGTSLLARARTLDEPVAISNNETGFVDIMSLFQNYPNPFNPKTTIHYHVTMPGFVQVEIFDIMGRNIKTLSKDRHRLGPLRVEWDGKDNAGNNVASGVYFYRLRLINQDGSNLITSMRKMSLIR